MPHQATILAGCPSENNALFHRVSFDVGDPAAWLMLSGDDGDSTHFIVRDIEVDRAKRQVKVDHVYAPADFTPAGGLSGDRATATAQAVAEFLSQHKVDKVTADRTLPFIFAWHIQQAGIAVDYDADLGVLQRRTKSEQEIEWLREAQAATEETMRMALETIARATVNADGQLVHAGEVLTSEIVRSMISNDLVGKGYSTPHGSIVATRPDTADCHKRGSGPLLTGEAVIVDIFPRNDVTKYCGDCTRTVVHGQPSDMMLRMHKAVCEAKVAAIAALKPGASADSVHDATKSTLAKHGFPFLRGMLSDDPVMPHGTGHGIGLDVHEPILLDDNGGTLLAGEALTIEPGLYSRNFGGVRVEDMVVTSEDGPINLNTLPDGLSWD